MKSIDNIDAHINAQGETTLYAQLVKLVKDIASLKQVKTISIDTNGSLLTKDYVNKLVSSDIRATVLSAQNMAGRLFYAAIIPIVGYIIDAYSLIQAITVLGITTLIAGTFILIILHRVKVI